MATKTPSFVKGRALRVTKLDSCGRPVIGDNSVVVSKGFTSVAYTANTDDGEEINVPNAAGETCVYVPAEPSLRGYGVELTFCNVDPDLFAMLTGQDVIYDANGDAIGFVADTAVKPSDVNFALEVWSGTPPSAEACDNPNATGAWGYFLLPFLRGGVLGDFTIENAEVTFTISNAVTLDGNRWGLGLHPALLDESGNPSLLTTPLTPTTALIGMVTGLRPPMPQAGARPYLDPAQAEPTDATATATALSVEFDFTPGGNAFWVDFGDGTWDYSADGSSLTHEYESAGTYTYTVYAGPGSVTKTITVTA